MTHLERPTHLFKYRTVRQTKDILTKKRLWFASPKDFNDPFDCKVSPSFDAPKEEYDRHYMAVLREQQPFAIRAERRRTLKRLKPVIDGDLYDEAFEGALDSVLSRSGVLCFGQDRDKIVMWSHYADGHQGVCLGFRTDDPFFDGVRAVENRKAFPDIPFFPNIAAGLERDPQPDLSRLMNAMLFTKSSEWIYEREWRVIRNGLDKSSARAQSIPPSLLESVILGCRMRREDEQEIVSLIRKASFQPRIFRAKRKTKEFGLAFEPL